MRFTQIHHTVLSAVFALAMLMQSVMLVHVHDDDHAHTHIQCQILSKINWSANTPSAFVFIPVSFHQVEKIELDRKHFELPFAFHSYHTRAPPLFS